VRVEHYRSLLKAREHEDRHVEVLAEQMAFHEGCCPVDFSWGELGVPDVPFDDRLDVWPTVMRPHMMGSSRAVADYLWVHRATLSGATVADVGCGCGVLGVLSARLGAKKVLLTDICPNAIDNTQANVGKLRLQGAKVQLFNGLSSSAKSFDIAIFNHPFFPGDPLETIPISVAMIGRSDVIEHFFKTARQLNIGRVIVPFWFGAGMKNDPRPAAEAAGFRRVEHDHSHANNVGPQKNNVYVYLFEPVL
jgi:hypothetical protein